MKNVTLKFVSDCAVAFWFYGFAFADVHPVISTMVVTVTTIWLTVFTLVNGFDWMVE